MIQKRAFVNVYASRSRYFGSNKPTYASFVPRQSVVDLKGCKKRCIIIDSMDLLDITDNVIPCTYQKERYDSNVILQLVNFFDYYGFRVIVCLHDWDIDCSSNPEILHELVRLGFAYISTKSNRRFDECDALNMADLIGAVILTNNTFDHHWNAHGENSKAMFCNVKVTKPKEGKNEWVHYTFLKPIEHFYFINGEKPKDARSSLGQYFLKMYNTNPINRIRLRNLFKFVACISWYHVRGEYNSTFFDERDYDLPIDIGHLKKLEAYASPNISFKPNKKTEQKLSVTAMLCYNHDCVKEQCYSMWLFSMYFYNLFTSFCNIPKTFSTSCLLIVFRDLAQELKIW